MVISRLRAFQSKWSEATVIPVLKQGSSLGCLQYFGIIWKALSKCERMVHIGGGGGDDNNNDDDNDDDDDDEDDHHDN